jgi:hypothetical protein
MANPDPCASSLGVANISTTTVPAREEMRMDDVKRIGAWLAPDRSLPSSTLHPRRMVKRLLPAGSDIKLFSMSTSA